MKSTQKPFYLLMVLALLAGLLSFQPATPVQAFATDLFFSEHIEGSSYNKAVEIYNGTGTPVELSNYRLELYSGGATSPSASAVLSGTLASGDVFVAAHGSADATILAQADLINGTVINFNGDDVIALRKISPSSFIDVIGQFGSSTATTKDKTLVRKADICTGDSNGSNVFDPVTEWDSHSQNTFTYLGSHVANCVPASDTAPTVTSTVPNNGAVNVAVDANIVITFSEPVIVADGWYSISCGTSNTYTAVVDPANPVFTLNPTPDFTAGETCTVTIDHNKVYDNDETVNYMAADHSFSFTITNGCVGDYTPIYDIQGSGLESPLVGQTVTTQGVVVGDFQTEEIEKEGFFIQDPTGDGNSETSDGIFIFYPGGLDVNEGDEVRLTGSVSEYYGATQITGSSLQLCSNGNSITPTPVSLPVIAVNDFEKVEGMLVTFSQPLIISEYFNFDRYGEIVLTSERHMTPTAVEEPGSPEQTAAALAYQLDRITLDDGRTNQNPDPAIHPNGMTFDMTNLFRGGDTVAGVTGVMDYDYSLYRVQLTEGGDYVDANPRTTEPDIIESDLKIASFNVLNYFITLDDGSPSCGPNGNSDCRGANDEEELTRQRNKILAAMAIINADIFGLMEIENDRLTGEGDAVADLVSGLNVALGTGTYSYIDTGSIGGDAIKQAILYKPASVTPVGTYKILDSSVDARFIDDANRPVVAQVFMDNGSGEQFVVAVNHLKSKGSGCNDLGDPDLGDGAGNCNLTRLAAAEALVDWLADTTKFPDAEKKLIIGDLNSYDKEDPIDAIKEGADDELGTADDYLDMIFEKRGEYAYGYVYDGQTGYLDHALANQIMAESIVDVNFWHINADEPDMIDYDMSFKADAQDALYAPDAYRSSDHDPVIVTIERNYAPTADDKSATTTEDTAIGITLTGMDPDGDTLSYVVDTQPTNGTVAIAGNVATYTPAANFNGTDSFTFTAFDGSLHSVPATVNITVNPVPDAPMVEDQDVTTVKNTSIEIILTATDPDGDGLTYEIVDEPVNGTVVLVDNKATYTPATDYIGPDSFTFIARDAELESTLATVSITVTDYFLYLPIILK